MGVLDWFRRRPRASQGVVLALGGGGARGVAHIGVLAVLEEARVAVVGVAGTSAGAVVGAMWLSLGSAAAVEERWREFLLSGILPDSLPDVRLTEDPASRENLVLHFARTWRRRAIVAAALERHSLVQRDDLDRALAFLLPDVTVESLRLPFAVVATDFDAGRPVTLTRGPVRLLAAASSAVPGVVPPYAVDGRALVDGGVVADVPVRQARELADRPVVAVDTGDLPPPDEAPERMTVPRALMRASIMTHQALREELVKEADLIVRPRVAGMHWSEFQHLEAALEAGRSAAKAALPQIRELARTSASALRTTIRHGN
jgi:NTE family protein